MSRGIGRGRLARCCIKAKQPIGLKAPNYLATEPKRTHTGMLRLKVIISSLLTFVFATNGARMPSDNRKAQKEFRNFEANRKKRSGERNF